MSTSAATPAGEGLEALESEVFATLDPEGYGWASGDGPTGEEVLRAVLASDWLAARESAAATRARAEALREAADFCQPVIADALGAVRNDYADGWREASAQILAELRTRADNLAPDTAGESA